MAVPDPIGVTVILNSGVRAVVLKRIERSSGAVYLVRVVDEDTHAPTMLTVPATEIPDLVVVALPATALG